MPRSVRSSARVRSWAGASTASFVVLAVAAGIASTASSAAALTALTVSVGRFHTCAVTPTGGVECWGDNLYGELGNGTTTNSSLPVNVVGLSSGVLAVSAGEHYSCAVLSAGTVKCWGIDESGQLGDGGSNPSPVPVTVVGLSNVVGISAGEAHACALSASGSVACWGANSFGEIGDASGQGSRVPVQVTGLSSGVAQISAGNYTSCAALLDGTARCWGWDKYGQLGDGGTDQSLVPVAVANLPGPVSAVTAGSVHTCALITGGAYCWGRNTSGQLGNGTTTDSSTPVAVTGMGSGVSSISAGGLYTCAVGNGAAKCWGSNPNGQLGNGTTTGSTTPVGVSGLASGVGSISAGAYHTCGVSNRGMCWGANFYGQLGNGTRTNSTVPVPIKFGDATGPAVTVALTGPNGGVPDGSSGWFVHGPVTGRVTADDTSSGGSIIQSIDCNVSFTSTSGVGSSSTATADFSITNDGATSVTCTATDVYGNTSTPSTATVSLDTTAPSLSWNAAGDSCSAPGNAGWCLGTQRAAFTASDASSGIDPASNALMTCTSGATSCDFGATTTTNGSAVAVPSGAACDVAGNCASSVTAGPYGLDSGVPTLSPSTSPSAVQLGGSATASAGAADPALNGFASGIATQICDPLNTSVAGLATTTCQASDVAGNDTSTSLQYVVQYVVQLGSPVQGASVRASSTLSIFVRLTDVNGVLISDSEGASLASACRVQYRASGAQAHGITCLTYDPAYHRFSKTWKLGTATGTETLTAQVTYPGTSLRTSVANGFTIASRRAARI